MAKYLLILFLFQPLWAEKVLKLKESYPSPQALAHKKTSAWLKKVFFGTSDQTPWKAPLSICFEGKDWAVTDNGAKQVWVWMEGKLKTISPLGGWVSPVDCLFWEDELYITDAGKAALWVYHRKKKKWKKVEGAFQRPTGLCHYKRQVMVVDSGAHKIYGVQKDQAYLWHEGGLQFPTDCAGKGDKLYVADSLQHRIVVFNDQKKIIHSFGKAGDGMGDFAFIRSIAVDKGGNLYISDVHLNWIQIFSPKGELLFVYGGEPLLNHPSYLFIQGDKLWVADTFGHQIRVLKLP